MIFADNEIQKVSNGDIFVLKSKVKKLIFNKKTYKPLIKDTFLIPIPYKIKRKTYQILIDNKIISLKVVEGNYKVDILKVSKSKTNINKKQQEKNYIDYIKVNNTYKKEIKKQFNKKFIYPLKSKITSLYGNKRVFNNKIKSFHSGLDMRAKMNTKIKSINDGIVVFAGDLFYSGKTVIINHGLNIFSVYAHLNQINVINNQKIKQSYFIGLSGKSGRVSGPHLHFSIVLNEVKINPMSFINKINKILH